MASRRHPNNLREVVLTRAVRLILEIWQPASRGAEPLSSLLRSVGCRWAIIALLAAGAGRGDAGCGGYTGG